MNGRHITRGLVTASLLTLPFAAQAADAPGVFQIPGTQSTMKIYGFVELNGTEDLAGRSDDINGFDWASWLPCQPLSNPSSGVSVSPKNQLYLTARTSRIGFEFVTPSSFGPIKAVFEGDFNSPSPDNFSGQATTNGNTFRARKAYGQVGNLLMGLNWSNFMDGDSLPDTVDFNVVPSANLTREAVAQYTFHTSKKSTLALSAEAPFNRQFMGNDGHISGEQGSSPALGFQDTPNFVANYTYADNWGHVSLRGVTVQYKDNGNGALNSASHTANGYGLGLSGHFNLAKDTLAWSVQGGDGIGRFMFASTLQGAADDGAGINLWKAVGFHVGYTHVWNSNFRSNLVYSRTTLSDPGTKNGSGLSLNDYLERNVNDGDDLQPNKSIENILVNTFWTVNKTVYCGLEYAYGRRETFNTYNNTSSAFVSSNANLGFQRRINFVFHVNFF